MDLKQFIYGHCVYPVRVRVYDTYSESFVVREIPCGKCLHCRNTHVNEWVTRLYAQAEYSEHVYYITLDYAPFVLTSPVARNLAAETAACYHNINSRETYGMHPLLLCRNHLQDYLKRFRKNNPGTKIQYFGCGEYGTHADGHGYGRPHFHLIVFSNTPISHEQFAKAWSVNGYTIGRVDYNDLRANGSFDENNKLSLNSAKYVFKYVCKYLQKTDFDFQKLATIDFHRTYFKSLCQSIRENNLFSRSFDYSIETPDGLSWSQYVDCYSPFTCCSKRPSIGASYLAANIDRFSKCDFRLFGLSSECVAFPKYYLRKTKENLCEFVALGEKSNCPSSNSRIGHILHILSEIATARLDIENLTDSLANVWCNRYYTNLQGETISVLEKFRNGQKVGSIYASQLHMYDTHNNIMYQFNGYGYTLWQKVKKLGFVRIDDMDITEVLNIVSPKFGKYYNTYVKPMHNLSLLHENELYNTIAVTYGEGAVGINKFYEEVHSRYNVELNNMRKNKLLQQNSKIQF